jgi:alpha-L-arabinofuranosidase
MKSTILNGRNLMGCLFCLLIFTNQKAVAQNALLSVDASQVLKRISPLLYGSCIEDVNHEIYGGLYDQKIFGESFEEPSGGINFKGFTEYEGSWNLQDSAVSVQTWPGAKLVSISPVFTDGSAEVNVKFTDTSGDNAGFIFHVSESGNGADNFNGYEISLLHNGTVLRLGKHLQNYALLQEVNVSFIPGNWTNLKVKMQGARILVYINKAVSPAMDYTDNSNPILSGTVGLRTWNSNVLFKNLIINSPGDTIADTFKISRASFVSNRWDEISNDADSIVFAVDQTNPYNGKNSQSINYIKGTGKAGISNLSLNRWGISVKEGQVFQGRLYLRAKDFTGPVTVALQSADGTSTYATQTINQITETWTKYPFTLTSDTTDPKARFAIWIENPGKVWIDQVVLMQTGDRQFKGLPLRNDIGNAMVTEGLSFLRYGGTMVNVPGYRFMNMIGDPDLRAPYQGNWYPYSTNGFGIEDFLKFCESARFTGAFAINTGETATDAADMVEYLNGDISTVWGAKRAANGHPESFHVKYIEIGNEEVIGSDDSNAYKLYNDRFDSLYTAMHAKDTTIQFIASAWWRPGSSNMKTVFNRLDGKASYWDYHLWADDLTVGTTTDKDLTDMQNYFLTWDPNTKMKCAIFEENGNLHNMQRALGHATVLNAVRRHSDFVLTSCQANALQPYLQNDNGWDQGQIFFTPSQVWEMPPFYAQQMASANHLPLLVLSGTVTGLDITATRNENGDTIMLHVVNTNSAGKRTTLSIKGFSRSSGSVNAYTLSGPLSSVNSPTDPESIKTIETTLQTRIDSFSYTFPAYSFTILRIIQAPVSDQIKNVLPDNNLKIYPSPANQRIIVEYNGSGKIEIIDMNGRIVLSRKIANTGEVDISGLSKGIYYVRSKDQPMWKAVKLLKS